MRQQGFSESGFEKYHKPTRREQFLAEMDEVIPWKEMCKENTEERRGKHQAPHDDKKSDAELFEKPNRKFHAPIRQNGFFPFLDGHSGLWFDRRADKISAAYAKTILNILAEHGYGAPVIRPSLLY